MAISPKDVFARNVDALEAELDDALMSGKKYASFVFSVSPRNEIDACLARFEAAGWKLTIMEIPNKTRGPIGLDVRFEDAEKV